MDKCIMAVFSVRVEILFDCEYTSIKKWDEKTLWTFSVIFINISVQCVLYFGWGDLKILENFIFSR